MKTLLGHLEIDCCGRDFTCPHCGSNIKVEWTTEYGDPLDGEYEENCPKCGKEMKFTVETTTTYTVKK